MFLFGHSMLFKKTIDFLAPRLNSACCIGLFKRVEYSSAANQLHKSRTFKQQGLLVRSLFTFLVLVFVHFGQEIGQ